MRLSVRAALTPPYAQMLELADKPASDTGAQKACGFKSRSVHRQKNSAPFRFRGLLRSRENCISAESFFLPQIGPVSLGSDLENGGSLYYNAGWQNGNATAS